MEIIFETTQIQKYSVGKLNKLVDYRLTDNIETEHYVLLDEGGKRLGEFDKYEDALTQMNNLKGGK